ncbi:MAG: hypothetical protein FJ207_14000 [Gemmatimonadetes bacterium]|nr:hypothetical protein [Gemmatimonadota bacterium]
MKPTSNRVRTLQAQRRIEQGLAEMVGLVRGVVADGVVSSGEATNLSEWTKANPEPAARWPANILTRSLGRIFADGRLDRRERDRLGALLAQLAQNPQGIGRGFPLATDLPITRPEPDVVFEGQTFVFAGELAYGPTRACEREALELGGTCERSVNRRTDYVVIGSLAASDWAQGAFGTLVDEVVQYRSRGVPIAIITEEHWASALP